jgi:hypothetical protein
VRGFRALAFCLALSGCAAGAGVAPTHDDASLPLREGKRVALRSDLDEQPAAQALERLEKLEALLDRRFPWLEAPHGLARAFVLVEERKFREVARSHDVADPGVGAFACSSGEVVVRYRPEEWGQGPSEGWILAPRSAPVTEAVFRRRLESSFGAALERTRLEDGCARLFSFYAARELGETREAQRRERDDLLNAFLPLFLGSEPELARTMSLRGSGADAHAPRKSAKVTGIPGLNYAIARYLVEADGGKRVPMLRAALDAAAGKPGAEDAWAKVREGLAAEEAPFERWLRGATIDSLLDALQDEPVQAARWEARGALRLVAAIDVSEDEVATPEERAGLIAKARAVAGKIKTVRYLDEVEGRLEGLRDRRQPGGLEKVLDEARRELDARSQGYGHPAVEEGRARLGQALQERMKELSARREPG